jgi:predicted GNAT family acetyltransferase
MREYWEDLLKKDNENWVIYEKYWIEYWDNIINDNYKIKIIRNPKCFIILIEKSNNENYLYFAYVPKKYRKQGVLKDLMKLLINNYKEITLDSIDKYTDIVWEKIGFKLIKERETINHCSKYKMIN